jgi:hypothetical protein
MYVYEKKIFEYVYMYFHTNNFIKMDDLRIKNNPVLNKYIYV